MKKYLSLIISTLITSNTAFAAIYDTSLTCPTNFPSDPLVESTQINSSNYYAVQSNADSNNLIALIVQSDNQADSFSRAKSIIASDLTPAWSQAKFFYQKSDIAAYYCAYTSTLYQLSTESPLLQKNPTEAADYIITVLKSS